MTTRRTSRVIGFFILLTMMIWPLRAGSPTVKLSLKVSQATENGSTIRAVVRLRAQNTSSAGIVGLSLSLVESGQVVVSTGYFLVGGLDAGAYSETPQFTFTYQKSITQDPPAIKTVWNAQFSDVSGTQKTETIVIE